MKPVLAARRTGCPSSRGAPRFSLSLRGFPVRSVYLIGDHYSDRIEIQNPGGLYGDLTPEQFPDGTAYRNPILAEAAKVLGFVNRFGRGIQVVQRELQRNGSPPAVFEPRPNFFLTTVWRYP
jgi:predicted HTH transcriptional regulator